MRISPSHRLVRPALACMVACVATLATAPHANAQFGLDFRLTGPPAFVSQTARSHAWSVAADDLGNVHVVYFDTRSAPDVPPYYRRFDRALNAWGPEVRVPSLAVANTRYVAIAADCFGNVHVVWVHTVAGDQHYLYYKKRSAAGSWGPDVLLQARTTDFWDIRDPCVATDYLGDAFVGWAEGLKNPQGDHVYNILYQANDAGGNTWSGPQGVTNYTSGVSPAPGARAPSISAHVRESGAGSIAHFAWADYPTSTVRYRAVRFIPSGGTSLRGTASLALGTSVAPPTVASRCDEVQVVWADPASSTIVHRLGDMTFSIAETTFFNPAVPTGLTGQSPSIAVDGLGNVELVMLAGGAVKHARRSFMTGAWTAPVTVSDPPAVPNDPSIAADTRGAVHVIWTDTRTVPTGTGGAYYDVGGCVALPAPALASRLEEDLSAALAAAGPDERLPVLITLRDKPDMGALKRSVAALKGVERRREAVRTLRITAGRTQARVIAELTEARRAGLASEVRSLWSAGAVAAHVTPAELERLARLDEIESIAYDPPQQMIEEEALSPAAVSAPREATATPAWSVDWIGAPTVWNQGYRGACVLVAIIDTGVDYNHPDLAAHIWTNADEIPANGIDDDGNGYVDDIRGWDTSSPDNDPLDQNGHGTHVGGSVAGDGAGGTITGVAPEARLMPVKVLAANGSGTFAKIMEGVEYAVDNGAQVLNLSLGGLCTSPGTRALLRANADAVAAAGVTMCVASANDRCKQRPPNLVRSPGDAPPPWLSPDQPVLGALGGVTTVGATGNMNDNVTTFSSNGPVDWSQPSGYGDWRICDPGTPNVGLIRPDVAAPGQDVLSTILGGGYGLNTGTSMATPHVAGLAALILSRNPLLTSDQVHQILETTALDLGPAGKDNDYGSGRVRAPDAIAATPAPASQPVQFVSRVIHDNIGPSDNDGRLEPGETADIEITLANAGPYLLGNVAGALAESSPHVTVTDPLATFGDIPPSQTRTNAANLWRVTVSPSAPANATVPFTVTVSSYGACGVVAFTDTIYSPLVAVDPTPGVWPALAMSDVSPNPAGGAATLAFTIGTPGHVRLTLYDVRGRMVRTLVDGAREAGVHRETWDGRDDRGAILGAGVYLARVESAGHRAQRKFAWLGR